MALSPRRVTRPESSEGAGKGRETSVRLELRGLDAETRYEIEGLAGPLGGGDPPMVSSVALLPSDDEGPAQGALVKETSVRQLMEQGMPIHLPKSPQATWIVHRLVKSSPGK